MIIGNISPPNRVIAFPFLYGIPQLPYVTPKEIAKVRYERKRYGQLKAANTRKHRQHNRKVVVHYNLSLTQLLESLIKESG